MELSILKDLRFFDKLATSVKILILETIKQASKTDRDVQICASYFGLTHERETLAKLGEKYGLSRERIRQIVSRLSRMVTSVFSLEREDGLYKYVEKGVLLKTISNYGIEAFFVFLTSHENEQCVMMAKDILLYGIEVPENFNHRLEAASQLIKKYFSPPKEKDSVIIDLNEFDLMIDDNGELLTDVSLLMKLKEKRHALSVERRMSPNLIYTNKQLVVLATLKPVCKATYTALSGFTAKSWDAYGCIIAKVIKEHVS